MGNGGMAGFVFHFLSISFSFLHLGAWLSFSFSNLFLHLGWLPGWVAWGKGWLDRSPGWNGWIGRLGSSPGRLSVNGCRSSPRRLERVSWEGRRRAKKVEPMPIFCRSPGGPWGLYARTGTSRPSLRKNAGGETLSIFVCFAA